MMSNAAEIVALLKQAKLTRQTYGIAMAQCTFGAPRGIWLECTKCDESQVIVGSRFADDKFASLTDTEAAQVFRRHGWTGRGPRLLRARCPKCSPQ